MTDHCAYCDLTDPDTPEPFGSWIHRDHHWLVAPGAPDTTMAGALLITSRRHYIDFTDMTTTEAASFGPLLTTLDRALRATTDAERVHLVSTRDRIPHFHAWLYPRPATTSPESQDTNARAYAEAHGWEVVGMASDLDIS